VVLWLVPVPGRGLRSLVRGLALLAGALTILVLVGPLWSVVPHWLWLIQFPYRLETYVVLCAAGLAIAGLLALARAPGRRRTALLAALVAILVVETAQATAQAWRTPSFLFTRHELAVERATQAPDWWNRFSNPNEFTDVSARVVSPTIASIPGITRQGLPARTVDGDFAQTLPLPVVEAVRSHYDLFFPVPRGGSVITNVNGAPFLVAVGGGRAIGRTRDSRMVVQLDRRPDGQVHLSFSTARSPIVLAGVAGSAASALAALALLLWLAVRDQRPKRWRAYWRRNPARKRGL
jgi:hypothetical protein